MDTCLYQSSEMAAFFGLNTDKVLDEATDYLLGQFSEQDLKRIFTEEGLIELDVRCSAWSTREDSQGFFLEVSKDFIPGGDHSIKVGCEILEDLIVPTAYIVKFRCFREFLIEAIEGYEMCMEDAFCEDNRDLYGSRPGED